MLNSEYAVRVHDAYTYDAVSREIIGRWAYPFVPDANLLPGSTYRRAQHHHHHVMARPPFHRVMGAQHHLHHVMARPPFHRVMGAS